MWIIQEYLHAQQFVFLCGNTVFEAEELLVFAGDFAKYPFLNNAMMDRLGKARGQPVRAL